MKSRNFSIRLSNEVYELLNKITLHTGMRKREIIEKAILEFANNRYSDLLSKEIKDILKESIESSISKITIKEEYEKLKVEYEKLKEELENTKKNSINIVFIRDVLSSIENSIVMEMYKYFVAKIYTKEQIEKLKGEDLFERFKLGNEGKVLEELKKDYEKYRAMNYLDLIKVIDNKLEALVNQYMKNLESYQNQQK